MSRSTGLIAASEHNAQPFVQTLHKVRPSWARKVGASQIIPAREGFPMSANPFLGVLLHAIGGLAAASFYIPYKRVKGWVSSSRSPRPQAHPLQAREGLGLGELLARGRHLQLGGGAHRPCSPHRARHAGGAHGRPGKGPGLHFPLRRALGRGRPHLRPLHAVSRDRPRVRHRPRPLRRLRDPHPAVGERRAHQHGAGDLGPDHARRRRPVPPGHRFQRRGGYLQGARASRGSEDRGDQ